MAWCGKAIAMHETGHFRSTRPAGRRTAHRVFIPFIPVIAFKKMRPSTTRALEPPDSAPISLVLAQRKAFFEGDERDGGDEGRMLGGVERTRVASWRFAHADHSVVM